MPPAPASIRPAPTWDQIAARAAQDGLTAIGGLRPGAEDPVPPGTRALVLLAPDNVAFWPRFNETAEASDGRPDPLDRHSRKVIGRMACDLGAKALFPFTGPPWRPFIDWALRSGRVHAAPVGLLVNDAAGLFFSLRGALALRAEVDLPPATAAPCDECPDQPCRDACPVGALLPGRPYDVPACRGALGTPGIDCLAAGCAVRRACPVSARRPRDPAQSAFHMRAFHGNR